VRSIRVALEEELDKRLLLRRKKGNVLDGVIKMLGQKPTYK